MFDIPRRTQFDKEGQNNEDGISLSQSQKYFSIRLKPITRIGVVIPKDDRILVEYHTNKYCNLCDLHHEQQLIQEGKKVDANIRI